MSKTFYKIPTDIALNIETTADLTYEVVDQQDIVVGEFVSRKYAENFITFVDTAWKCGFKKVKAPFDMIYADEQLKIDLKALEMVQMAQLRAY